jgi:hypothetical protein
MLNAMNSVLVIVTDLMFAPRIVDAVRSLGANPVMVDGDRELAAALTSPAAGAVIDLHERSLDARAAIQSLSRAGVPVLAFGRHTEPGLLRAAREAGARFSVPRSQLVDELPQLLGDLLAVSSG